VEGVDVTARGQNGHTALSYAAMFGHLEIVKWLVEEKEMQATIKNDAGRTALHDVACCGQVKVLKYLIQEREVDVNIKGEDGSAPLHYAAKVLDLSCSIIYGYIYRRWYRTPTYQSTRS
jgi:ankyrin repeat protein